METCAFEDFFKQRINVEPRERTSSHSYSSHLEDKNLYQKLCRKIFIVFFPYKYDESLSNHDHLSQSFNNCPFVSFLSFISLLIMVVLCMKPSTYR